MTQIKLSNPGHRTQIREENVEGLPIKKKIVLQANNSFYQFFMLVSKVHEEHALLSEMLNLKLSTNYENNQLGKILKQTDHFKSHSPRHSSIKEPCCFFKQTTPHIFSPFVQSANIFLNGTFLGCLFFFFHLLQKRNKLWGEIWSSECFCKGLPREK